MSDDIKCFALTFLPPTLSVGVATLFMVFVCYWNYYLNVMMGYMLTETSTSFIISRADIVQVCIYVSFGIFILGLFIKKFVFLLKQLTMVFAMYMLFSFACFLCNFLYVAFTSSYVYYYKPYWWFTRQLVNKYQDLDDALTLKDAELTGWKTLELYMNVKMIVALSVHCLVILFMLYYFKLISSFTAEREGKEDVLELQVHEGNQQNLVSYCGNTSTMNTMNTNTTINVNGSNDDNSVSVDSQAV